MKLIRSAYVVEIEPSRTVTASVDIGAVMPSGGVSRYSSGWSYGREQTIPHEPASTAASCTPTGSDGCATHVVVIGWPEVARIKLPWKRQMSRIVTPAAVVSTMQ